MKHSLHTPLGEKHFASGQQKRAASGGKKSVPRSQGKRGATKTPVQQHPHSAKDSMIATAEPREDHMY